ncbi:MAG: hypothetical protein KW793_01190, partial [Candidatus Doudnabacteria bacterium]|nr:hypothetical protein [Candidatus Doudnabacteria bacterium]
MSTVQRMKKAAKDGLAFLWPDGVERAPIRIKKIYTHTNPHQDEHIAIMFLKEHGERWFPGIANAEIECIGDQHGIDG